MEYKLKITDWETDKSALSYIRGLVFIEEQNVPEELEWDEFDEKVTHILVTYNNIPVACSRIKADGHIGRMAVLNKYRGLGIGTAMLKELLDHAKNNCIQKVYLHAQTSAVPFYEKLGFNAYSEEFIDANIPHKSMELSLTNYTQ